MIVTRSLTASAAPLRAAALLGVAMVTACNQVHESDGTTVQVSAPIQLDGSAFSVAESTELPPAEAQEFPGLYNVYRLSDMMLSGSEPEGEAALQTLADLGVRTVLSVDGKIPDHEAAERLGLRYVHLPVQYKGLTDDQIAQLVRTFTELEGPFYVHCFHGKHRGPAAAAIGRLVVDGAPREVALAEMKRCGTSSKYEGLYEAVATRTLSTLNAAQAADWNFPPAHRVDGIRGGMIPLVRAYDYLYALSKNDWQFDPGHPDVDPVNEGEKLAEALHQCDDAAKLAAEPADLQQWMAESAQHADALVRLLRQRQQSASDDERTALTAQAEAEFQAVRRLCTECHRPYRNR